MTHIDDDEKTTALKLLAKARAMESRALLDLIARWEEVPPGVYGKASRELRNHWETLNAVFMELDQMSEQHTFRVRMRGNIVDMARPNQHFHAKRPA